MEPFEYAIKKDVRNNPIVREVDRTRQREQWQWAGIGAVLVVVLLLPAWQHWQLLRQGFDLEPMKRTAAEEEEKGRQLRLEIETLSSPQRIEHMAIDKLHMVHPSTGESIVIERVQPSEPPDSSVVAQR